MTTQNSTRRTAQVLLAALTAFLLLLSVAPGADAQSRDTKGGDTAVLAATEGCPSGWVEGRFGCQPENLTTKGNGPIEMVAIDLSLGCPDKWVPASVPGGCLPGYFVLDTGRDAVAFVHTCAFGPEACSDMVLAAEALGGECVPYSGGVACEVPTGPPDRP